LRQLALFVSDSFSELTKGVGSIGFIEISNSSITNLGDEFGDIFISSSGGYWLDDFSWSGPKGGQCLPMTKHHSNHNNCARGRDAVLSLDEHGDAALLTPMDRKTMM
jgi:hypothetical protein